MDFASKLKLYRVMLNLTQNEVADSVGVERSTYAQYETGKIPPTYEAVYRLSRLFGVYIGSDESLKNENEKSDYVVLPNITNHTPTVSWNKPLMVADVEDDINPFRKKNPIRKEETMEEHFSYDLDFGYLSPDEKELVVRYRIRKALAEANSPQSPELTEQMYKMFFEGFINEKEL